MAEIAALAVIALSVVVFPKWNHVLEDEINMKEIHETGSMPYAK